MPVIGGPLLLAINRDLGAVHVQHYPMRQIDGFCIADQLAFEPRREPRVRHQRSSQGKV
jgi:hypothetical protein